MRHKLCRSFHPWCPGIKNRCLLHTVAGHYRCTSGQVVTSQKTPQISVAQVSYGVSTDRSVRKNNKKTTTWKCTEPNDTDLIIHHFIFSSTNVSKLSDPQERLFLITCFIMIGFSNGCSDVGPCGLIFMATVGHSLMRQDPVMCIYIYIYIYTYTNKLGHHWFSTKPLSWPMLDYC